MIGELERKYIQNIAKATKPVIKAKNTTDSGGAGKGDVHREETNCSIQ